MKQALKQILIPNIFKTRKLICHKKSPSESKETKKNKGPAAGRNQAANLQVDLTLNFAYFQSVKNPSLDLMIKLVKSK